MDLINFDPNGSVGLTIFGFVFMMICALLVYVIAKVVLSSRTTSTAIRCFCGLDRDLFGNSALNFLGGPFGMRFDWKSGMGEDLWLVV